jgi:hypothetical protein
LAILVAACGATDGHSEHTNTTGAAGSGSSVTSGGTAGAGDVGSSTSSGVGSTSTTGGSSSTGPSSGAGGTTGGGTGTGTGGSGGSGGTNGVDGGPRDDASVPSTDFSVLTDRYDNFRSAANTRETILTTSNVTATSFGLLFSRLIDGNPYAQPLYVPGLTINGGKHNVVFVATSTNHIYAFDADDPAAGMPLWSRQLAQPGDVLVGGRNPNTIPGQTWCKDMFPFVGITGTPVIDLAARRMYLVTKEGKLGNAASYASKLHAIDLLTGADAPGSPVLVAASVNGMAKDAVNGKVQLDGWKNVNRPGLLLHGGKLYIAFGSHCDDRPYHGWVLAYDPATLKQESAFNTSPDSQDAAIWQSGIGLAANSNGIFFVVGNGGWRADGTALAESVVRLNPNNTLGDWFTPSNVDALNGDDLDLLSVILAPNSNYVFGGGKEGVVYVIDQMNMTHHGTTDTIAQKMPLASAGGESGHLHNFAFWNDRLYVWPEGAGLRAWSFANGKLNTTPVAKFDGMKPTHPGGIFSISSNGTMPGTGIVWGALVSSGDAWHAIAAGTLAAVDAMSGAKLWDSKGNAADDLGNFAKFSVPTVANGKVYVATFAKVNATSPSYLRVYGLKK